VPTNFSLRDGQVGAGDGAFLVAYLDDVLVGCAAVRRLDETTGEIAGGGARLDRSGHGGFV
jgi:hypothetical protein